MGCDIHCFVEVRDRNKKWKKVTGFTNDYYNSSDPYCSSEEYKDSDNILMERNYWEFAVLAGVRNHDGIEPISDPKGVPDNVSDEIRQEIDDWGDDGHSHSYLTAEEISKYNINTPMIHSGYISCKQYEEFLNGKLPTLWSDGIGGCNVIEASNDECLKAQQDHPELYIYTKIEWSEPAIEVAAFLFGSCLKQLMNRSKNGSGNDVRIVFWFDN